jgi:pteridine reductase
MAQTYPLALVTGAAHRVGKAFACSLAHQGYAIALHYHSSLEKALVTAEEIRAVGVPVFPIQADLTDDTQIQALFATIDSLLAAPASQLDTFSVLVNSAAVMQRANARTLPIAEFDSLMAVNLRAPFLLAQRAFQRMKSGLIVNISDVAAHKVWSSYPAYTVSKAGLESLTKILAVSFAPRVRVNAIAPGLVMPNEGFPVEDWERLVTRLPIKRAAFLDEITGALDFMLKNEYITGQTITVDGGYSLL